MRKRRLSAPSMWSRAWVAEGSRRQRRRLARGRPRDADASVGNSQSRLDRQRFHALSLGVWLVWLVPYVTGMLSSMVPSAA
jgi:hypothetical protein